MHNRLALIDVLAVLSGGGTLAAWQEQLDWGLRVAASVVAIVAGVLSLYWHFRTRRLRRTKGLD